MTDAVHQPQKESYVLVEFLYNGNYERYTNWGSRVGLYLSVPELEVKLPQNTGSLSKGNCEITLPINSTTTAFVEPLVRGTPFANVRVTVTEFIRSSRAGETSQTLVLFTGWVLRKIKNPNNRPGFARLLVQSPKSKLDKKMGVSCDHECPWVLYNFPCAVQGTRGPQKADERKLVTLSTITGTKVTVSGSPALGGSKSYRDGYMEYAGATIRIRNWDSGTPNTLYLNRQPPAEWIGKTVTLVPGCDHSIEHCRAAWNNEGYFGGIGFAIPAYNPIVEWESS